MRQTTLYCRAFFFVVFFLKATSYQIEEVSYFQIFSMSKCCQILSNALLHWLRWWVFAPLSILWEHWVRLLVSLISNSSCVLGDRSAPRPWVWLPHVFVLKLPLEVVRFTLTCLKAGKHFLSFLEESVRDCGCSRLCLWGFLEESSPCELFILPFPDLSVVLIVSADLWVRLRNFLHLKDSCCGRVSHVLGDVFNGQVTHVPVRVSNGSWPSVINN